MKHLFANDLKDTPEFENFFTENFELKVNERYVGHLADGSKCFLKAVVSEDCKSCVFSKPDGCGLFNGFGCATRGVILIKE